VSSIQKHNGGHPHGGAGQIDAGGYVKPFYHEAQEGHKKGLLRVLRGLKKQINVKTSVFFITY
jgi:hypothetical protein